MRKIVYQEKKQNTHTKKQEMNLTKTCIHILLFKEAELLKLVLLCLLTLTY